MQTFKPSCYNIDSWLYTFSVAVLCHAPHVHITGDARLVPTWRAGGDAHYGVQQPATGDDDPAGAARGWHASFCGCGGAWRCGLLPATHWGGRPPAPCLGGCEGSGVMWRVLCGWYFHDGSETLQCYPFFFFYLFILYFSLHFAYALIYLLLIFSSFHYCCYSHRS